MEMICTMEWYPKPKFINRRLRQDGYDALISYTRRWVREEKCMAEIRSLRDGRLLCVMYWDSETSKVREDYL